LTETSGARHVDSIPTLRVLKGYRGDWDQTRVHRARDDVAVRFLSRPASVTQPKPIPGDHLTQPNDYQVKPMAIIELRGGAVTQEGFVFTERNELLRESVDRVPYIDRIQRDHPELEAELDATKIEPGLEAAAILSCQRSSNYFHWWIDVLPRCWAIRNSPYRGCTLMTPQLSEDFQGESLRLLGQSTLPLSRPLQRFRRLVFVRGLTYGSSQSPLPQLAEFAQWCRGTLELSPPREGRKLFVSRRTADSRRLVNEDEVLAALGGDFERVDGESLSMEEKISLFSAADVIVAPHGAGLTNLLFCCRPAIVIELIAEDSPPLVFRRVAGLLGHRYLAVGCEPAGETPRKQSRRDMRVSPARVAAAVASLEAAKAS
jgi:capsular polysaccharide biosynthesis protein